MTTARHDRTGRLDSYGTTVFAEMSARAAATGAVNLGQGFPDEPGPPEVLEAARAAIAEGLNQYAPGRGVPALLRAIAAHSLRTYGTEVDPESQILVTAGATEAIAATVLAACRPGDEVITFEPFYDSYAATIELAGARQRTVALRWPGWDFDEESLEAAVSPRTRLVLVNTPNNPTGRVFSHAELEAVAAVCRRHDLLAVTDEVYEHLVFTGAGGAPRHERLATFEDMAERTVTISSAGKTFSVTGWKVGWAIAPPRIVSSVMAVKQFLTFTNGTPLQLGVAAGLSLPPGRLEEQAARLKARRDLFVDGLEGLGWPVRRPEATYFCTVDTRALGAPDPVAFCRELLERVGVAAIPMSAFYRPGAAAAGAAMVRFAFCKREEVLNEALSRLAAW